MMVRKSLSLMVFTFFQMAGLYAIGVGIANWQKNSLTTEAGFMSIGLLFIGVCMFIYFRYGIDIPEEANTEVPVKTAKHPFLVRFVMNSISVAVVLVLLHVLNR